MKATLLVKLRVAAAEWANAHHVETVLIEAQYSGLGDKA